MTSTTSDSSEFRSKFRTHLCAELNGTLEGQTVVLSGWVNKVRDHGGLSFFDLRDRSGICQIMIPSSLSDGDKLRSEFVVRVEGSVRKRPDGMINKKIASGEIELEAQNIKVLSQSEVPPFTPESSDESVLESTRLKYRYLDLRRPRLQRNILLRHKLLQSTRNFFANENFTEVETPILYKSTPEGARDYLVPSRVHPGEFYALPQSPQTLKQLLMISGFERYFQVTKCFRDEDLRADRQPEFTQLDLETSFMNRDEVLELMEKYISKVWKECLNEDIPTPFTRISHQNAMSQYGSDKPDMRFGLKLQDSSKLFENCQFKVFTSCIENGGKIVALPIRASELKDSGVERPDWSRKFFDGLNPVASTHGLKGVAWIKLNDDGWQSPIAKFFSDEERKQIEAELNLNTGDYVLFGAEASPTVEGAMGHLRLHVATEIGLIDPHNSKKQWAFVWVLDWPLFEKDEEGHFHPAHHMFTRPAEKDKEALVKGVNLGELQAEAYDLALNGFELGGGSLRIYESDVQQAMFDAIGFTKEEAAEKFGYFVEALKYGTPPHGGIAFGIDRIAMLMAQENSIRDVIAFPKTARAQCPMSESPSEVAPDQLAELRLQIQKNTTP